MHHCAGFTYVLCAVFLQKCLFWVIAPSFEKDPLGIIWYMPAIVQRVKWKAFLSSCPEVPSGVRRLPPI